LKTQQKPLTAVVETGLRDYALYVAEERAIPDVRDGLKPVQRRVAYAAFKLGLRPSGYFRKSAKIIGETMGNYHPHGDLSIGEALAVLTQHWKTRYPLFEGQGNWGSPHGEPHGAFRYIEAKLSEFGWELFRDIQYVRMANNYDQTDKEPTVLPAPVPLLLLNGYTGIAVGVAGSIPSHNLRDVCRTCILFVKNPKAKTKSLLRVLRGPDQSTGGVLTNPEILPALYKKGKGTCYYNANYHYEDMNDGTQALVITGFPPGTNLNKWIDNSEIKEMAEQGIISVLDQSTTTIKLIIMADDPQVLSTKIEPMLRGYKEHYEFTVFDRSQANGKTARIRYAGLQGLLKDWYRFRRRVVRTRLEDWITKIQWEIEKVEAVLAVIANRTELDKLTQGTEKTAIEWLKSIGLNLRQAEYILTCQIRSILKGNKQSLTDKRDGFLQELKSYQIDLQDIPGVIIRELKEFTKKFGDERRTKILGVDFDGNEETGLDTRMISYGIVLVDGKLRSTTDEFTSFKTKKKVNDYHIIRAARFFSIIHSDGYQEQHFSFECPGFSTHEAMCPVNLISDADDLVLLISEDNYLVCYPHVESNYFEKVYPKNKTITFAVGIRPKALVVIRYKDGSTTMMTYEWLRKHRFSEGLFRGWSHQLNGRKNPIKDVTVVPQGWKMFSGTSEVKASKSIINTVQDGDDPKIIDTWKFRRFRLDVLAPAENYLVQKDGLHTPIEMDKQMLRGKHVHRVIPISGK